MNIFRRISLAVRGDSSKDKVKVKDKAPNPWGRPEPKSTGDAFPAWATYHDPGWRTPSPEPARSARSIRGRNDGWGTGQDPISPWHDHSHCQGSNRYAQCAELWDRFHSRWMTFDPKTTIPEQVTVHAEQTVYFCVTARYDDYWSEPYHILTHFEQPLLSFVNVVCESYGSWGNTDSSGQTKELEMGQAFRSLKKTKARFEEIKEALSKSSPKSTKDKLDLVRSLGNMAVDTRTPESELDQYLKNIEKQLKVFIAYLEKKFKPIEDRLASAIRFGYMEFDLLPYYFEPGQEVWFNSFDDSDQPLAMKVDVVHVYGDAFSTTGHFKRMDQVSIEGNGYAWDGVYFSAVTRKVSCYSFTGSRELSKLPVQLLTPEKREELTARGRRYKAEAGINYRIVRGERVVIDRLGFLDAQRQEANAQSRKVNRRRRDGWDDYNDHYPQPNIQPAPFSNVYVPTDWTTPADPCIEDERLCFLPVDLYGYNLSRKEWQSFDLDEVKPVEFDSRAWDHLVLDADVKTLIKGLVEVTTKSVASSGALVNDVIAKKGGGLTSVLYGPPGTGKTLTAEAVAELLRRPLLTVGSSDLPRDPSGMEDTLRYVLKLATTWDAVLLIDEADVFLEQRSLHEIERNALVSVALRVLEYHRGVVFLTTNRIKVFDEAFASRFSIAVKYPELNKAGRYLIWSRFLELAGYKIVSSPFVTNDDLNEKIIPRQSIEELAAKNFNGRTIKNLVRTAQALALSENSHLKMDHIHIVVRAQEKFLEDFAVERSSSS
ncbi:P-loop containing nucleoside triphosphate hydrolase protein [Marasmius fiardii PR-910]|nr:P-loop containing nucleoside triphosphate hydrolase protein [Marasmius fiardii PR-910]